MYLFGGNNWVLDLDLAVARFILNGASKTRWGARAQTGGVCISVPI